MDNRGPLTFGEIVIVRSDQEYNNHEQSFENGFMQTAAYQEENAMATDIGYMCIIFFYSFNLV